MIGGVPPSDPVPFVARQDQLDRFAAAVERAREGEPGILLVGGDAGVGKTRMLSQAARTAESAGARVVVAHCVDLGEVGIPYLPFAEAVDQLARSSDAVRAVVSDRPALARALGGTPPTTSTGDAGERGQVLEGFAAALAAGSSAEAPLVVVVEDLHWADPSSRDLVRFLVARLRSEHLLLVMSYRTDDMHRRHPVRALLAELHRHARVEQADLRPFSPDELRDFTTAVLGHPMSDADLAEVERRSEGNAYYAEELVEAGALGGSMPWSLADVLHARIEQLAPATQRLVQVASVSGRTVSHELVSHVFAATEGQQTADLTASLREAVAHHVLEVEGDTLAFRHALLAEAVYGDLLPGERVSLHRAYLTAFLARPDLGPAAQAAHHALVAHELPQALALSHQAARAAGRVYAHAEEQRHLEQVLALWDAVDGPGELVGLDVVDVLLETASAASLAGAPARALQLATDGVERAADDPVRQAGLRHRLARYLLAVDDVPAALDQTGQALDVLGEGPATHDLAWTLAAHARSALNDDLDDLARESAGRAVTLACELGTPDVEADALTTLAVLEVADVERSEELLLAARERAVAADDLVSELRCWFNLASNRFYAGHLDQAQAIVTDGTARAAATGATWSVYGAELRYFGELVRYLRGDLTPPSTTGAPIPAGASPTHVAVRLYAALARGDAGVVDLGLSLRPEWDRDQQVALVAGGCTVDALTQDGRPEEAVDLATELVAYLSRTWSTHFLGSIWLAALALAALSDQAAAARTAGRSPAALVERGDQLRDAAVTAAERGRPRGGRLGPEGRAWLARVHAEHSRLTGENDPALWEAAARAFDFGYRYESARTRWRWAEALLDHDDREKARAVAAEALDEASATGALPLVEALHTLSRRARLGLHGERAGTGSVLTERETAVLLLVAEGLSNRQIGERLFISTKTVSVHVSNVLAKLGVSGRAEAVSVAHRRGLLGGDAGGG